MKRGTYQEFKTKYDLLSTFEKDMLQVLALIFEEVTVDIFTKVLKKVGVDEVNGKLITIRKVQEIAERMIAKRFVDFSGRRKCSIKEYYRRHLVQEAFLSNRWKAIVLAIRDLYPMEESYWRGPRSYKTCLREMQFALLANNSNKYTTLRATALHSFRNDVKITPPEDYFFFDPLNKALLRKQPIGFQTTLLYISLFGKIEQVQSIDELLSYLAEEIAKNPKLEEFKKFLANGLIFQGKLKGNEPLFKNISKQAWVTFLRGDNEKAIALFEEDFNQFKKTTRKKKIYLEHIAAPLHLVALLKTNQPSHYATILKHAKNAQVTESKPTFNYLSAIVYHLSNENEKADKLLDTGHTTGLDLIFQAMVGYWMEVEFADYFLKLLDEKFMAAQKNGLKWLELEFANILAKVAKKTAHKTVYAKRAAALEKETGIQSMITAVRKVEQWERVLRSLEVMTGSAKGMATKQENEVRIAWLVDFKNGYIQPKEQKIGKSGKWSKGRNIALKRLKEGAVESMSAEDHRVAKTIRIDRSYGYYGSVDYYFDGIKTYRAMIGHPLLFRHDNPTIPIELTEVNPELIVEEKPGRFEIKFSHPISEGEVSVTQETPTRFNLVNATAAHLKIAKALGGQSIAIPSAAKKQLGSILKKLGEIVPVHSALAHAEEDLPTKRGNANIHVHIMPFGDGFKLEMFTKPLVTEPPYFKPGKGRKEFVAEVKKKRTLVKRTLSREKDNARKVESECPTLQQVEHYQGEWTFEETETCLNILLELEPLKESGLVTLEWPKGEKVRLNQHAGFGQFSMRIDRDNDWFGVTGELKLDNDKVLDMKRLLELIENTDSRFVEISDGQFVALTKNFRKQLSEMNSLLYQTKDGMRVHGLAAAALEDFTSEVNELEVAKEWKQQVNRLKRARKMKTDVPSTFQADLRPYQLEGYQWLTQLAYWGVGACLADDMGLGKTVQGLAMLVERAKNGPALVIAPASVCRNWRKESRKFAPTLNPIIFGQGDRKETIKGLKAYDLLISTYGLLQSEAKLFASKKFNTIILDEAQAIKNKAAKRSKAAMSLKGNFKVITTGTPIENHLGELWNLLNFINPGLLGTSQSFQEKYALPIEKYKNKDAQNSLKKLIQPFILRRRKNDVLEELPSKTEITLSVELSAEERAFYEALRQKALEQIESDEEKAGHPGMQILAQITRLRQACCNPKLVQPNVPISSAKLQLFGEVLEELVENGHKALVFSQFVGHLKIIEDFIKTKNISYQYLDGSTSLSKREDRIAAFQAGEGDVFLISLKAGGVGLNLTAADYVIHMDPWWNPAVEDQASDRAHRIGQQRPVTIYRLVTENTIEEKIVALHHHKRDLADSLLEGTERSGRMSSEELLALIKEG
ncbi:MAG: DEAD/DEAH box helicase [Saprospiraceae bacterium]